MKKPRTHVYDFLVIGSGLGGLLAAVKLARAGRVAVVTKGRLEDGATGYAQGGVAAVTHAGDSTDLHIADTLRAGVGLCERAAVETVVREGPARVQELLDMGVPFSLRRQSGDEPEAFDLGLEGGHSRRRVLHVADRTGKAIHAALIKRARRLPGIDIFEDHCAVDLLVSRRGRRNGGRACLGAYVLDQANRRVDTVRARATILATGGAGKTYLYTSNPDVASGDGMAMAFRAGVPLANMEFVQFHPTCLFHPQAKSFLISEAVRGEGAVLRLENGKPFMRKYHPRMELAPRDVVARAIDLELKKSGARAVFLDITHRPAAFIRRRFPVIYRKCREFGFDMTRVPLPVVPAAHYFCGGVVTDAWGGTPLPGLFAVGEVAYTGLHGANRLASNSLLETAVFAHRAAERAREAAARAPAWPPVSAWNPGRARDADEQVVIAQNWDEVRRLMWNYVGIGRSNKRLERALRRIDVLRREIHEYYWNFHVTAGLLELRNIALVGELVIRSALARKESRGLHANRDYPRRDDRAWRKVSIVSRGAGPAGRPRVTFRPVGE